MNTLRGGMLRDVYALIYQLQRKSEVKVTVAYIAERLGYSNRSVQYAIAELKEMGLLEVGYADGKSSIFKALTPANLAPPTPYISKDKILDYPPPPPACARERLQKWFDESDLKTWVKMQLTRNDCTDLDTTTLLDDFYDNDFKVRERCEQGDRLEVLSHFQSWLPKYLTKLKNENNNEQQHRNTTATANGTPANATQRKPYSRISQLANTEFDID